jgi:FkbM family methyltransferase
MRVANSDMILLGWAADWFSGRLGTGSATVGLGIATERGMHELAKALLRKVLHAAGLLGISWSKQSRDLLAERLRLSVRARSLRWLLLTLLNIRAPITIKIADTRITVRTATPDLEVAISCLCGEFDRLYAAIPALQHHLIIDAGGYIGTAAISFTKKYPSATIVTLEPNTANYRLLVRNTAGWPNIVAMDKALTPEPGVSTLYDRGTGAWGFTLIEKAADRTTSPIEQVQCITLDQIIEQIGTDGVDILKIDIEGGEHSLLSRNIGWIDKTNGICIELHDRIVPGCSEIWQAAMAGRNNFESDGEKHISLKAA